VSNAASTNSSSVGTDRMALVLSRLLTACVIIAATLSIAGVTIYLFRHRGERTSWGTFEPAPPELRGVASIVRGALGGDASSLLQLAVVALVATPALRVLGALVFFILKKDRIYTAISLIVLAGLALGWWGLH
jgi:uncharacterized membrane protein